MGMLCWDLKANCNKLKVYTVKLNVSMKITKQKLKLIIWQSTLKEIMANLCLIHRKTVKVKKKRGENKGEK